MFLKNNLRWWLVGVIGRMSFRLWGLTSRMTVVGDDKYKELRDQGKAVVFLIWHGRIFIVPYFFRKRNVMPLISPSEDGEIPAQIMSRWGYKILRGSSSHSIKKAWSDMKQELLCGGEVIIVPDGPKGPKHKMKSGGIRLAHQTGAYLVPFSFSASRRKHLKTWDDFLMSKPFSKVVAIYGDPISVDPILNEEQLEEVRQSVEKKLVDLDAEADSFFDQI
jgi:lysophospholipid acyltransferase (LPLAT)-like uncharacterized protein